MAKVKVFVTDGRMLLINELMFLSLLVAQKCYKSCPKSVLPKDKVKYQILRQYLKP